MKVKLIQYNFGHDPKYLQLCKTTENLNKKYCNLYGYDHLFDYLAEDVLTKMYGRFDWSLACVYKLQHVYDNLMKDDADVLAVLDADAAINKPTIKIEDLIDEQHDLYLTKGNEKIYAMHSVYTLYQKLTNLMNNFKILEQKDYNDVMKDFDLYSNCEILCLGWIFHNEGFYIVKNTPLMKQYFKDCLGLIDYFIHRVVERGRAYDGMIMDLVLLHEKYNKSWKFLYDQAQGGLANSYETHFDEEKTFVLHNYGEAIPFEKKLEQLKGLRQNKWWKKVLNEN